MSENTIRTTATASRDAFPELATVEVLATDVGPTPTAARGSALDLASRIEASLSEVAVDRVRTVELEIKDTDEMFEPVDQPNAAFQAHEKLEIDCQPSLVEDVVLEVTDAGGTVPHISYGLYDDVRRELEDSALTDAMNRARAKAATMASAEDSSLGEVLQVRTQDSRSGMSGIVDDALESGLESDVHPGPITVTEAVEVEYELLPA